MIPISLNPKTSQNINYKLTEAYLAKVITIDDIAMTTDDIPNPAESNNKVIITNDYGVLDYSLVRQINSKDVVDLTEKALEEAIDSKKKNYSIFGE